MSITRRFRNNLALRLKARKPALDEYDSPDSHLDAHALGVATVEDVIACIQEDVPGCGGARFRHAVGAIE